MRFGVTERGDAGLDLSWKDKLHTVDMAILITKNITPGFKREVVKLVEEDYPFIIHAGCTGWGGTYLEPHVPEYHVQIDRVRDLLDSGVPKERIVLRIDPIIPTKEGLERVENVVGYAVKKGLLPGMRIRISVMDEYRHVKERLRKAGHEPFYPADAFQAPKSMMDATQDVLEGICGKVPGLVIETCAEPFLDGPHIEHVGCVSAKDLKMLGLPVPDNAGFNPQNRRGCLCLEGKVDLLSRRGQCPHGCLYCYWI